MSSVNYPVTGGGSPNGTEADNPFGTDNVLIKSDGTQRSVQATAIVVDDSNNVSGAGTISSGEITSSTLTASRALISGSASEIQSSNVTTTELGYLSGVSSAIQTQIDAKTTGAASSTDNALARFDGTTGKVIQNSLAILSDTGAITGLTGLSSSGTITFSSVTASRVLQTNVTSGVEASAVTTTELGYLSGVTSSVQTQIETKVTGPASATDNAIARYDGATGKLVQNSGVTIDDSNNIAGAGTISSGEITSSTLTASRALVSGGTSQIQSSAVTSTELGYVSGVTSAIQTQINAKQNSFNAVTTDGAQVITGAKTFTSPIILEEEASTPTTPPAGDKKLYAKTDGKLYTLDDAGNEVEVGSSAGGLNLILNPDGSDSLDKTATDDIGDWINSGAGTTASRTTTAGEIPLEDIRDTAIKITLATGTNDYTRVRFQVPAALQNQNLSLSWDQRVSGLSVQDMKVELYNYSDNYVSDVAEVVLFSDDTSGDTFIAANDGSFKTAFSANGREYYELRFINNGGTSGYLSLNSVTINNNGGANGAVITDWEAYTPAAQGFGSSPTFRLQWRRVGGSIEVKGDLTGGTSGPAVEPQIGLPNGYTVNFASGSTGTVVVGRYDRDLTTSTQFYNTVLATDGDTFVNFGRRTNGVSDNGTSVFTTTLINASERGTLYFSVPVLEFQGSGTVNLLDRGVTQSNAKFSAYSQNENVVNGALVPFGTPNYNIGGGTFSAGQYTVPATGYYKFSFALYTTSTSGATQNYELRKNTTRVAGFVATDNGIQGSKVVFCNEGDTLDLRNSSGGSRVTQNFSEYSHLDIERIADHSAIAPLGFGESTSNNLGLVYKNKWQTKDWPVPITAAGSLSTTWNNLVAGRQYKLIMVAKFRNSTSGELAIEATHNASILLDVESGVSAGGSDNNTVSASKIFTANASTITFAAVGGFNGSNYGRGGFTQLIELNNYEDETSDFT